jgi:hypothetical protein
LPKSRKHLERRRSRRKHGPKHPASGIAKFFVSTVLNAGGACTHRVLYHYTSLAGAIGIIQSQKFWATAHDCTNDDAELISANPIVTAVARSCRINAKGASRTVLDVFLENYPTSMLSEIGTVYPACFSTERDDPNQWRAGLRSQLFWHLSRCSDSRRAWATTSRPRLRNARS